MRPLSRVLLVLLALGSSAAEAVPLHLHVDGVVYVDPLDPVPPLLGIENGAAMTIDAYFDPAAAEVTGSASASFAYGNPAFSLTAVLGSVTFSQAWSETSNATVSKLDWGASHGFQEYQIGTEVGSGPGCSPFCGDFFLSFRDDVAPFDLFSSTSIEELPDLSATTVVLGSIQGWHDDVFAKSYLTLASQSYSLEVVPEPGTGLLLAAGLALLGRARARARTCSALS